MPGPPAVSPAPQPMDLSASVAGHPALSAIYMAAAVAVPLILVVLIGLRLLSVAARWGGWDDDADPVSWARRLPYELFVLALPFLAAVGAERLALISLFSGTNRSPEADRLIFAAVVLLVGMVISASRFLRRQRSDLSKCLRRSPAATQIPIN